MGKGFQGEKSGLDDDVENQKSKEDSNNRENESKNQRKNDKSSEERTIELEVTKIKDTVFD
eukprot:Awhi_evm1s10415